MLRSIAVFGLRKVEDMVRPGSVDRARSTHNILLPQFESALGTAVHVTPLVEALRALLPDARIVVPASGLAAQVFCNNPRIDRLIEMPNPLTDLRGALRAIREANPFGGEPYTTILTLGNERTNIILWSMLAGPSRRIGYAVEMELLHNPRRYDPKISQIGNNLRLLNSICLNREVIPDYAREPHIYPMPALVEAAERRLVEAGSATGRRRIAMVTQTSPNQRKSWRPERFQAVGKHLIEQQDADLVFIGSEKEAAAVDALRAGIPYPTISVAGKTDIQELAAILTRCDAGVTLDTGPLHVGRAVGLPMAVIAPAWSPPLEWLPIRNPRYRILKNAEMAPPPPDDYIIDEVSVDEVIAAIEDLLRNDRAPEVKKEPPPGYDRRVS